MASVTTTMRKKKPMPAAVGVPSCVAGAAGAAGAVWERSSCVRARVSMLRVSWGRALGALLLQLALEPLELGVVRLVRPHDVVGGEQPGDDDGGDAERDREGRHLADLLRDESLVRRDEKDVAVVADEQEGEQHEADRPPLRHEALELLGLDYLMRRLEVCSGLGCLDRRIRHVCPPGGNAPGGAA